MADSGIYQRGAIVSGKPLVMFGIDEHPEVYIPRPPLTPEERDRLWGRFAEELRKLTPTDEREGDDG